MLSGKFEKSNITVNQALDDANTLIVNTAIDLSMTNDIVVIVGEDIHHQIQMWLGNEKSPIEWGWHVKNDLLLPIPLKGPLIPESLLNLISCNCTKGCTASCGRRKHGLKCSMICGYCKGNSCLNAMEAALTKMILNQYQMKITTPQTKKQDKNTANQVYI